MATIPGQRLLAWAARWFDAATVARVFEPLVADWQREWLDAAPARRQWVRLRGLLAFGVAAASLGSRALVLAPMPASMTRRVLARMIIFTSSISGLLTIPFLIDLRHLPAERLPLLAILLWPSGAALAFPFAATWATDVVRRASRPTPKERIAAARVAMVASVFSFVLIGWIVPVANQQYRELAAPEWVRRPVSRGVHELTTVELFVAPGRAVADTRTYKGREAAIEREIHQRAVLSVLPAVLVWLRFAALSTPRRGRVAPLPATVATMATIVTFFPLYFLSVNIEPLLGIRSGIALWLPLIVLAGWARITQRRVQADDRLLLV